MDNPLIDVVHFMQKPGWPTPVFCWSSPPALPWRFMPFSQSPASGALQTSGTSRFA